LAVQNPEFLLRKRAELFAQIRSFFLQRQVLEVEVPLISRFATTDFHIESIPAHVIQTGEISERYLITSPEFYMKRLLAQGSPSIFYLGKVFRQDDHGRKHHHEFSMLEWYRLEWDEHRLMDEVVELLQLFFPGEAVNRITYGDLLFDTLGINPYSASLEELQSGVVGRVDMDVGRLSQNDCLDVLFTHCVEPVLRGITLVHDYPVSQAALAKTGVNQKGESIAHRFEVFVDDLELGNGYRELTDAKEQRLRFQRDLSLRAREGKRTYPHDEDLLLCMEEGLPECAGLALGVDRLLMKMLKQRDLESVIPFLKDR
jgi:lysyl-tRNA synthetase class 2